MIVMIMIIIHICLLGKKKENKKKIKISFFSIWRKENIHKFITFHDDDDIFIYIFKYLTKKKLMKSQYYFT